MALSVQSDSLAASSTESHPLHRAFCPRGACCSRSDPLTPTQMSDPSALASLLALGIPRQKAIYALKEHGGEVEAAADWCLGEGAHWTPNSLFAASFAPSPNTRRSPSPPGQRHDRSRSVDHHPPGWTLVPHRLLTPGTSVAVTLKQDQGTDRTVEGVVAERLTRGDHPRGVKVRLQDGRVGRVVRIL
ncbi:MFS polyamine transporter [Rhodotorula toruloides]|nr:MFS polyamine transporter [Rhodotorula toruloides]